MDIDINLTVDHDKLPKMEKDMSALVDQQLPHILALAKENKINEALEELLAVEKQTRQAADMVSNSRVLVTAVQICFEAKEWDLLNEYIVLLSKKRGQLKQSIAKMVQEAMTFLDKIDNKEIMLKLIDTLRLVTEGKIYVEVERARLTQRLAKIREEEGNIAEAADILQKLQVETFGSMEKREKVEFILEQMRLLLAKNDYSRTQLISRKISERFFNKEEYDDLKIRYYLLLIQYGAHEKKFLDVCQYHLNIADTKSVQENPEKLQNVLKGAVIYCTLSPYGLEQSGFLHSLVERKELESIPIYKEYLKCFITPELLVWSKMEESYKAELLTNDAFQGERVSLWSVVRDRVIEHNIRVISKYYSRITYKRLSLLLALDENEMETILSNLVVNKAVYARIDRGAKLVSFAETKDPVKVLNEWSSNISSLLTILERTSHLINKEEVLHQMEAPTR